MSHIALLWIDYLFLVYRCLTYLATLVWSASQVRNHADFRNLPTAVGDIGGAWHLWHLKSTPKPMNLESPPPLASSFLVVGPQCPLSSFSMECIQNVLVWDVFDSDCQLGCQLFYSYGALARGMRPICMAVQKQATFKPSHNKMEQVPNKLQVYSYHSSPQ